MSNFDELLFHKMNIFRFADDGSEYDSKEAKITLAEGISCSLEKKNLSKINEPLGRVEVDGTHLLLTRYPGIKAGDEIEVYEEKSGYKLGTFIASCPEPIPDREGIHHFEIDVKDKVVV
ncbi:hypothetical protein NST14_11900 [Bacillus sp. FSL W8-0519]|uniref:hypothetical protein n=1 Tax=Bacillus sp. FSL W8-0519 TaxID=2954624 RepID=UPI000937F566